MNKVLLKNCSLLILGIHWAQIASATTPAPSQTAESQLLKSLIALTGDEHPSKAQEAEIVHAYVIDPARAMDEKTAMNNLDDALIGMGIDPSSVQAQIAQDAHDVNSPISSESDLVNLADSLMKSPNLEGHRFTGGDALGVLGVSVGIALIVYLIVNAANYTGPFSWGTNTAPTYTNY